MSRTILSGLEIPDRELEASVGERLDRVEVALSEAVSSDLPLVAEAAGYLLAAGGKRFRPMVALLAGHLGDPADPRLIQAAVAGELTHLATLHHDDVIDESDRRRGIPSVNARWTNTVAILTGDFLFARASEIAADLGTDVSRLLASTIAKVCEGQILELEVAGRLDVDEAAYMDVIQRKTAALIATACMLGGMLSGADGDAVEGLRRYGEAIGLAFQLSDDIMDLTADAATLGKEPGVDLKEGVYTLPVIFALRETEHSAELRALLDLGAPDGDRLSRVLEIVRSDGSMHLARRAVTREVRRAALEAGDLPEGTVREALLHLAEFLAARCGAPT